MKTTFSQQQKKGFTLIELLVVIVILGSLAAVSYPLITSFMEKGDITKAKKTCDDLIGGIKTYHQDHTDLPIDWEKLEGESTVIELTTDGENDADLVHVLFNTERGKEVGAGTKAYMSADSVKTKADGLFIDGDVAALYDPWGKPYHIILNTDTDGSLTDPFDNRTLQNVWCIAYSTGPDALGEHHSLQESKVTTKSKQKSSAKGKDKGKKSSQKDKKNKKGEESESEEPLQYPAYTEEENEAIEDNVYSWKSED